VQLVAALETVNEEACRDVAALECGTRSRLRPGGQGYDAAGGQNSKTDTARRHVI
jgi:hypothetical protein